MPPASGPRPVETRPFRCKSDIRRKSAGNRVAAPSGVTLLSYGGEGRCGPSFKRPSKCAANTNAALPSQITAVLTWNGGTPTTFTQSGSRNQK